jgi:dihydroflavonol-4-reductase
VNSISPGDEVFVTGGTGFVGGHVVDALLQRGYRVRALVRRRAPELTDRDGVIAVNGDLRAPGALVDALRGCAALVHTTAEYSFAPRRSTLILETNLLGTAGLLEAARISGVRRAVVTSSSAAMGPSADGSPVTEEQWADGGHAASAYHESKVRSERATRSARIPVITVLPTAPLGPRDRRPTPTGRLVVDVMNGKIFGALGGGMNVVDVRDVAWLHVAALERGRPGGRYVAGGEDLMLDELFARIAVAAGRRPPRWKVPYSLAFAAGVADELRCRLTGGEPRIPLDGVRMGRRLMFAGSGTAAPELGYRPSPADRAIAASVAWYRDHGYAA